MSTDVVVGKAQPGRVACVIDEVGGAWYNWSRRLADISC